MPIVPIRNVAEVGLVLDAPSYEIPPNAWSGGGNIRFADGSVQKARGYSSVITPSVVPYGIFPAPVPGSLFWVYPGLAKVHAFIGSSDADITRTTPDYIATDRDQWQGGTFNGIFYLNNGVDDPQIWTPQALTTDLVALTNWPASTKARVLRPFKNYLVALDVSKSGTRYPRMIKWSHSAEPGTVPTSWDETDPTVDAGESTLAEGYDTLIDCLPLGDLNIIYTENETWAQRYTGGALIFNFYNLFRSSGLLGQSCMAHFLGNHFVVTQDDVIIHDGQQIVTKAEKRLRQWLFSRLGDAAFFTTKVIPDFLNREIWVCFAQGGGTVLDTALVWSWRDDTWSIRDLPSIRAAAFVPQALAGSTATWEGLGGTWAAPTGFDATWGDPNKAPYSQTIMMASPFLSKLFSLDNTLLFDGVAYNSYVEHDGLSVVGVDAQGRPAGNPNVMKLLRGIIPHFSAVVGTTISVYYGARDTPTGSVAWQTPKSFVVGTDFKVDCYVPGRFLAVKFLWTSEAKLQSYDLDVAPLGLL